MLEADTRETTLPIKAPLLLADIFFARFHCSKRNNYIRISPARSVTTGYDDYQRELSTFDRRKEGVFPVIATMLDGRMDE